MKFPEHKAGLFLEHNPHLCSYLSVAEYLTDNNDMWDWQSEATRERAVSTNELWTLHWYPNTPVGFNAIAAPALEELLAYALEYERG